MAIFGTIGLFVRLIPLPSSMIALVRAAMGALFLLAMILMQKRKPDWAGIRRNWKPLLLSSIAMATEWILLFESYRYTTVAVATLCYYMSAVFVIIAAPFILKEKITAHKAICAAAAVIGMVLVSGVLEGQAGAFSPVGVALGLTAAVFYAVIVLCNKRVKNVSSYDTTFIQLFTCFPMCCLRKISLCLARWSRWASSCFCRSERCTPALPMPCISPPCRKSRRRPLRCSATLIPSLRCS